MKKILLNLTYPIWHKPLVSCLNHAQEKNVISSKQWHTLASFFDRTQPTHYLMAKKVT